MTLLTWMKRANAIKVWYGLKTKRGKKNELQTIKEKQLRVERAHGSTKLKA